MIIHRNMYAQPTKKEMHTARGIFFSLTQKLLLFNIFIDNSTDSHQFLALKQHFGRLIFKDDRKVGTVMTVADNTGHGLVYEREQKTSSH